MLKCEKLEPWPANREYEREEVDVARGCFERLWKTIHQTATVSHSMRSTIKT